MKPLNTLRRHSLAPRAFTIIEIALCLGIIGFALVAIIAVLPRGLDVQKRNREETIIGQDAEMWMSALRSGTRGYDDLTNYVLCISNLWTLYGSNYNVISSGADFYTPSNSGVTSTIHPPVTDYPLTNGLRIIGLLSTPKRIRIDPGSGNLIPATGDYTYPITPPFQSNYVIAYVRAFSGAAVDKAPQTNTTILGDAFIYRMIVEDFSYTPVDTNAFCLDCLAAQAATNGLTADQVTAVLVGRTNLMQTVFMLQKNSHDFRLRFRWPVLPNGQIPNYGLATFRSMASGPFSITNDLNQPLFFVQPEMYVQATNN